jgi:DedD protein
MERQLLERMVGAVVLIVALVVIGPAILDGERSGSEGLDVPGEEQRTHTVRLNDRGAPGGLPPRSAPATPEAPGSAGPVPIATEAQPPGRKPPLAVVGGASLPVEPLASGATSPADDTDRFAAEKSAAAKVVSPGAAPSERSRPVSSASPGWFVQVGTFGQRENADRLAAQLTGKGFPASVSAVQRDGKPLHRVRVGPADGRAAAESLAARLATAGHRGQLVPP